MPSTVNLFICSMIVCIKICTCRYTVPERPPVELENPKNHHPEEEFRDHALRVGNIIADLLRNEIRLMLKINSTIATGKKHLGRSEGRSESRSDHHQESEKHINPGESHSKEILTSEETHVGVDHLTHHHPVDTRHQLPVNEPKVPHSHEIKTSNDVGEKRASGKTPDCVCPVMSPSIGQPNTLILEQKIYGASLSGESLDSNSPIIFQTFTWNPHNVSKIPASYQKVHEQTSPQDVSRLIVSKPSPTSTAVHATTIGKQPSANLDNQEKNITLHAPKTSMSSTSEPPEQPSYNPLAGLAETPEEYAGSTNPLDLQEQQETQQEASDLLTVEPSKAETQDEPPGFELVETTITEKAPEEVKGEFIEVHSADED